MKRRLLFLLLSVCLVSSLFPASRAQEENETAAGPTALCVARPGESVFLDMEEFQLLCRQATGRELESVTFSPLYAGVGKLTCMEKWEDPDVPPDTYYAYRSPQLSRVCFTPYSYRSRHFTGQEKLAFTMTNRKDETVSGVLILYVPEEDTPSEAAPQMEETVSRRAGDPIPLIDLLPETVWYRSRSTSGASSYSSNGDGSYSIGEDLTSAVFTLPSSDLGSLWLSYSYSDARKVLPGEVLYPDRAPNFYDVTFVPAGGETATVRLDYTASCDGRSKVPGSLTLNLTGKASSPQSPADKPAPVEPAPATVSTCTARVGLAAALYQACASRGQGSLETVTFDTLPTAREGAILSADLPVVAGAAYPYNTLAFSPGDSFQGGVTLRYVGTDSINQVFSGTLTLALDYPSGGRFQDLSGWEWASYAAQFLDIQKAVPYARSAPSFRPGDPATRMELVYALAKVAYPAAERVAAPGFSGLPDDPDLSGAASIALAHGLLQGDEEKRLFLDGQVTRQDALVMIHRALVDLGRDLPAPEDLSVFSDADSLSPYAREAAAVLCAMDILRGDGAGMLTPLSPITRAEMACLLYRAFGAQG